jgi:hypothetical protein
MKTLTILALAAIAVWAEDKPVEPKAPQALTEVESLKMENLNLKWDAAQSAQKDIQQSFISLTTSICETRKIALARCLVDPKTKTVSEAPEPKAEAKPEAESTPKK